VATDGDDVVALLTIAPGWVEQLYVAPDRLGEGIGRRLLDHARERSSSELRLYTFQVNARARRFYERNGFVAEWLGDGSANEEGQPDVRYVWRPRPDRLVRSRDGVEIAVFVTPHLTGSPGSPIVLVHGATADHTTWRTSGPLLAARHELFAIDRRGRGDSGDGAPDEPYAIEQEFDDLVAVVEAVSGAAAPAVDVVGHSYGGRIALGAALRTDRMRRLVVYEGAPPARGAGYQTEDAATLLRIEALVAAGDRDEALATFMREIVGMPEADLAAFRADPIWPRRAAAVGTTIRELRAETSESASLAALGEVGQPVLQILGGESAAPFGEATRALDARLRDGRVVTIPGARHAAHHTHPEAFVGAIESFLGEPGMADSA
jgi:pimeloyl-ACP methyl ester carboxylesterase